MTELPIKFDDDGLIPVVVQDDLTGAVLMLAYMNAEALAATRASGQTHFWSRSRQKLWRKGETSGHVQQVKSIHVNCYQNSLLIKVDQVGAACHTGFSTCYYRELTADNQLSETMAREFDPGEVYRSADPGRLFTWIRAYRWLADHNFSPASATSRLLRESSVPVLSARVADELRELAGVLSGDHQHNGVTSDVVLEGSQVLYWMALTSIRAGLSDELIVDAIVAGINDATGVAEADLPPNLRSLADEWQQAFFRSLPDQIARTAASVARSAESAESSLWTMIDRDLLDLRSRSYLAEFFAGANA